LGLARQACGNHDSWPLRCATEVVHSLGGDSRPFVEALARALSAEIEWHSRTDGFRDTSGLGVVSCAEAAVLMMKLKRDPEPYLSQAQNILAKPNSDSRWAYGHLAYAYALKGDLAYAKTLVEKIEDRNSEIEKKRSLGRIAILQASRKDYEGAYSTALETDLGVVVTDVLLAKACSLAKSGQNPSETLETATDYALSLPEGKFFFLGDNKKGVAAVCAEAGRILTLAGKNPDEKIKKALQITKTLDPDYQNSVLMDIAPAIRAAEKDVRKLYKGELDWYDEIDFPGGELFTLFGIHRSALKSGYSEFVNKIMRRADERKRSQKQSAREGYPSFLIQTALSYAQWLRNS